MEQVMIKWHSLLSAEKRKAGSQLGKTASNLSNKYLSYSVLYRSRLWFLLILKGFNKVIYSLFLLAHNVHIAFLHKGNAVVKVDLIKFFIAFDNVVGARSVENLGIVIIRTERTGPDILLACRY